MTTRSGAGHAVSIGRCPCACGAQDPRTRRRALSCHGSSLASAAMVTRLELRLCRICGAERPIPDFQDAKRRDGRIMRRTMCRHCRKGDSLERIRERREHADAAKVSSGCRDCPPGFTWPAVALDFDHRPGLPKIGTVSALITKGSWEDFLAEIAKCDVVCANHHRMRTDQRRRQNPQARAIPRRHRRGLSA